MIGTRTAAEAGRAIADALAAGRHPHALGGALALGVAGVPRGTRDVDVNVFVGDDEIPGVIETGWHANRFVPSIPFSEEAGRTAVTISVDGWTGRFLSLEAIAVFKLLFFRVKDRGDLERPVAVRGKDFDHAYVRRWIVDMMGEGDERVLAWDDIVTRFGSV